MRLYHGSDQIVERPEIIHKDHKTDFGEGFYTTESKKQAESWANRVKIRRESEKAIVSEYEFDERSDLRFLIFDGPTKEWFEFVMDNRMGRITHNYDVVIGPVAEDSVYRIIKLFPPLKVASCTHEQKQLKIAFADAKVFSAPFPNPCRRTEESECHFPYPVV